MVAIERSKCIAWIWSRNASFIGARPDSLNTNLARTQRSARNTVDGSVVNFVVSVNSSEMYEITRLVELRASCSVSSNLVLWLIVDT